MARVMVFGGSMMMSESSINKAFAEIEHERRIAVECLEASLYVSTVIHIDRIMEIHNAIAMGTYDDL